MKRIGNITAKFWAVFFKEFFFVFLSYFIDLAKDFLGTFSTEFVQAYGIEFAKAKLAEIDKETFKEDKPKRELTYRKVSSLDVERNWTKDR